MGLFLLPRSRYRFLGTNAILAFWFAYVMTRPLGASFADWMGKSRHAGGLGWGDGLVAAVLAALIVGFVTYLTVTGRTAPASPADASRPRSRFAADSGCGEAPVRRSNAGAPPEGEDAPVVHGDAVDDDLADGVERLHVELGRRRVDGAVDLPQVGIDRVRRAVGANWALSRGEEHRDGGPRRSPRRGLRRTAVTTMLSR